MSAIVLVDTSVFLNVLNVSGRNQNREQVLDQLSDCIADGDTLIIPIATILETGNHIAHVAEGRSRRASAERFRDQLTAALAEKAPWRFSGSSAVELVRACLEAFPDSATRTMGFGDLSILKEWEALCEKYPMTRVRIWTLDSDLGGCDHDP